jgi:hypothetical protein
MITIGRSLLTASALALGTITLPATTASAQGFGVNVYTPGVSVGVQGGGYPYAVNPYIGGGYATVVPRPVVVAPPPVVVGAPYAVAGPVVVGPRPYVVARPYYGYGYGYRGYPHRRYRW